MHVVPCTKKKSYMLDEFRKKPLTSVQIYILTAKSFKQRNWITLMLYSPFSHIHIRLSRRWTYSYKNELNIKWNK